MPGHELVDDLPPVSVVLTTRDRPRLLSIALACYRHQTYPRRELIVVDDGDRFPAEADAVAAVGGRIIRVEPGTPLGIKLNRGVAEASGQLCQKMDDDDWYAPRYLETMVSALLESWRVTCKPTVACLRPFLFFELEPWQVRRSEPFNVPGASLIFSRADCLVRPFWALRQDEDFWFIVDQVRLGASMLPVEAPEQFLAVRHRGSRSDRDHTWTQQSDGRTLEVYLHERSLYPGGPEALLPEWALEAYRAVREELLVDVLSDAGQAPTS